MSRADSATRAGRTRFPRVSGDEPFIADYLLSGK